MELYVISGVTGMTGNELARKLVAAGSRVIGFDNFFASSIETVGDLLDDESFCFYEYDLNDKKQMDKLTEEVKRGGLKKLSISTVPRSSTPSIFTMWSARLRQMCSA